MSHVSRFLVEGFSEKPPPPPLYDPSTSPEYRYVSYRDEVYGLSQGEEPRRMKHWLLKDIEGREHIAVVTTLWQPSKKKFTYEAIPPFDHFKPLKCYNQRSVMEYLDEYIPPEARQAPPEDWGRKPSIRKNAAGTTPLTNPSGKDTPTQKHKKKPRRSEGTKSVGGGSSSIIPRLTSRGLSSPSAAFITDPAQRQFVQTQHTSRIAQELSQLQGRCGIQYCLTMVGVDGRMHVLSSSAASIAASAGVGGGYGTDMLDVLTAAAVQEEGRYELQCNGNATANDTNNDKEGEEGDDRLATLMHLTTTTAAAVGPTSQSNQDQKQLQNQKQKKRKKRQRKLEFEGEEGDDEDDVIRALTSSSEEEAQEEEHEGGGAWGVGVEGQEQQNQAVLVTVKEETHVMEEENNHTNRNNKNNNATANGSHKKSRRGPLPKDPDVRALVEALASEPPKIYLPGRWQRDPFPSYSLSETLNAFEIAEDCGEQIDKEAVAEKLCTNITSVADAAPANGGVTDGPPGENDVFVVVQSLPDPLSGDDVEVQPTWGIDSYTRNLLAHLLKRCPEIPNTTCIGSTTNPWDEFIEKRVLTSLNALGDRGWDVVEAVKAIARQRDATDDVKTVSDRIAHALDEFEEYYNEHHHRVKPEMRQHVRAHPKGDGVVVTNANGLPQGTFVGEYLGEIFTPWRWLEREEEKEGHRLATRMGASREYYNIILERPKMDAKGYDVLYVDAVNRGNFVSRLSHSCAPNCRSVMVSVAGRLTVGVWTTRQVGVGEELCIDFAAETDVEEEAAAAVCLCGSSHCRGTFLFLSPPATSPLSAVCAHSLTLPHLFRMILSAADTFHRRQDDNNNAADKIIASKHGFRDFLFNDGPLSSANIPPTPLPAWLKKWVLLMLKYVDAEAEELNRTLPGSEVHTGELYTKEEAEEEVLQQVSARTHALAVAVDRCKMFLRHQRNADARETAPLYCLQEQDVIEYLWTGEKSVAQRAVMVLKSYALKQSRQPLGRGRRAKGLGYRRFIGKGEGGNTLDDGDGDNEDGLYDDEEEGDGNRNKEMVQYHMHAHDDSLLQETLPELYDLVAMARNLLTTTPTPKTADEARRGLSSLAQSLLNLGGIEHLGMYDVLQMYASTRSFIAHTNKYQSVTPIDMATSPTYPPSFLLALLCEWHRAGTEHVIDLFTKDCRGCLVLPDVEGCYAPDFTQGKYLSFHRAPLFHHIRASPLSSWPSESADAFRFGSIATGSSSSSMHAVYGSFQMDGRAWVEEVMEVLEGVDLKNVKMMNKKPSGSRRGRAHRK